MLSTSWFSSHPHARTRIALLRYTPATITRVLAIRHTRARIEPVQRPPAAGCLNVWLSGANINPTDADRTPPASTFSLCLSLFPFNIRTSFATSYDLTYETSSGHEKKIAITTLGLISRIFLLAPPLYSHPASHERTHAKRTVEQVCRRHTIVTIRGAGTVSLLYSDGSRNVRCAPRASAIVVPATLTT